MSEYSSNSSDKPLFRPGSKRLMDQVREVLKYRHYAIRIEDAYVKCIIAFIRFHQRKHPRDMGNTEIHSFLSNLAANRTCFYSLLVSHQFILRTLRINYLSLKEKTPFIQNYRSC
jgi:hypothetical protein